MITAMGADEVEGETTTVSLYNSIFELLERISLSRHAKYLLSIVPRANVWRLLKMRVICDTAFFGPYDT